MKKLISILITAILLLCLVSCDEPLTVVSEKPMDTDFIAAYNSMVMEYEYKYNVFNGQFQLVPVCKEVRYPDTYKVQYEVAYSDGTTKTEWREVDKPTYDAALKDIGAESKEAP